MLSVFYFYLKKENKNLHPDRNATCILVVRLYQLRHRGSLRV